MGTSQVPDRPLDFATLPKWMSTTHFFDLREQWQLFTNQLKSPCQRSHRVPFMAPDLPDGFVERPRRTGTVHQPGA